MAINKVAKFCTLCILALLMFPATFAVGQRDGVPSFSAADRHEVDTIDLYTLNPTFNIPVISKPGFTYVHTLQQSCTLSGTGQAAKVTCRFGNGAWSNTLTGMYVRAGNQSTIYCSPGPNGPGFYTYYTNLTLQSADTLDSHLLPGASLYVCNGPSTFNTTTVDGTGYTVSGSITSTGAVSFTIMNAAGHTTGSLSGFGVAQSDTDPFGNAVTGSSGNYVDALGATIANTSTGYSWFDTTPTKRQITISAGASLPPSTNWPCTFTQPSAPSTAATTQFSYPDNTAITLTAEQGVSGSGTSSGRIASFTLRTGGQISYVYGTLVGAGGAGCIGNAPMFASSLQRTTPDGTTTYTRSTTTDGTYVTTTTVLDPGNNKAVYVFSPPPNTFPPYTTQVPVITQVQTFKNTGTVSSPVYDLLATNTHCYNTNTTNCPGAVVNYPITQRDVYTYMGSSSLAMSHTTEVFDTYGNVTSRTAVELTTSPNQTLVTTATFSGCGQGSTIHNHPCDIKTVNGSNTVAEKKFTYNSAGAMTQSKTWTGGTNWLTTNYSPNANGTTASVTAPNNQAVNIGYDGSCNSLVPTSSSTTVGGVSLSTSQTVDCNGGLVLNSFDVNGNETKRTYDLMFRPLSVIDPLNFEVDASYPTANTMKTSWAITGASSATTTTVDGLARPITVQTTDGANYDTMSYQYEWDTTFWEADSSAQPCTTTMLGANCSFSTYYSYSHIDPLGRSMVDGTHARAALSNVYTANSVQSTLSPAPSGEVNKVTTTTVDGFGRPKSTVSGSSSQVTTSASYSFGSGTSTTTVTRGVQTHTSAVDAAGRGTSVTIPEAGTTTAYYDTLPANCPGGLSFAGQMVCSVDAIGTVTIYTYDPAGRHEDTAAGGVCRRLRYDSVANTTQVQPAPSGYVGSNLLGRIVEAETDLCDKWPNPTPTSDEWFSYDVDGNITDMWEWTPNSGGYYHTTATYLQNSFLNTISGIPGYPTFTITPDANGRPNTSTFGSTTVINGVTRDAAGRPTSTAVGTAGDVDTNTYDQYTGLMTNYTFSVNGKSQSGTLTWDQDGTLGTQAITDTFNTGGAHTCNFGYDDIARLTSESCTPSQSIPTTFAYDQYNNIGKSDWNFSYNSANNQMQGGPTYDADGRVTYDTINTYTWDAYGKMASARTGSSVAVCGTSGTCITYDAFGQAVEINKAGTISQILYGPTGRLGIMSGQTTSSVYLPQPGGPAMYAFGTNGSTKYILWPNWLGSKPLTTTLAGRTSVHDVAYAPYGETYNSFGSGMLDFTGDLQDTFAGIFHTGNRELMRNAGRWLSPDPAGASWNAYAYVTDPNTMIDPLGLSGQANGAPEGPCAAATTTDASGCVRTTLPNGTGVGDLEFTQYAQGEDRGNAYRNWASSSWGSGFPSLDTVSGYDSQLEMGMFGMDPERMMNDLGSVWSYQRGNCGVDVVCGEIPVEATPEFGGWSNWESKTGGELAAHVDQWIINTKNYFPYSHFLEKLADWVAEKGPLQGPAMDALVQWFNKKNSVPSVIVVSPELSKAFGKLGSAYDINRAFTEFPEESSEIGTWYGGPYGASRVGIKSEGNFAYWIEKWRRK